MITQEKPASPFNDKSFVAYGNSSQKNMMVYYFRS